MIAKAIDKICSLADPYMTQINGSTYSSKQLYRYDTDLRAEPIEWIKNQIKDHPGMHAASWSRLLKMYEEEYGRQEAVD